MSDKYDSNTGWVTRDSDSIHGIPYGSPVHVQFKSGSTFEGRVEDIRRASIEPISRIEYLPGFPTADQYHLRSIVRVYGSSICSQCQEVYARSRSDGYRTKKIEFSNEYLCKLRSVAKRFGLFSVIDYCDNLLALVTINGGVFPFVSVGLHVVY